MNFDQKEFNLATVDEVWACTRHKIDELQETLDQEEVQFAALQQNCEAADDACKASLLSSLKVFLGAKHNQP